MYGDYDEMRQKIRQLTQELSVSQTWMMLELRTTSRLLVCEAAGVDFLYGWNHSSIEMREFFQRKKFIIKGSCMWQE